MHWATSYIGMPWVRHEHDCWGFLVRVHREQFNHNLPEISIDALNIKDCVEALLHHPHHAYWQPVEQPQEGDAVLMSQNKLPTHVGVWVEAGNGGVLHCVQRAGVIFTAKSQLHRVGYHLLGYYRYQENL
ncbi:MAG TPA: hypothetical protein DCO68_10155 [Methylophilaceae bacterium]|nr:hypothetical protein [Methylophilaceae bacterium]